MASNPYVNKVQRADGTVLMDITDTTATENDVLEGEVFYSASGARGVGALGDATTTTHGLMSATDKTKLNGIETGAQVNPGNATQSTAGLMSATDKTKLDGIATGANKITKVSELENDSGYTTNTGTITGITMNGASKGTSGVVNLGTVITSHQDISGKADKSSTVSNVSYDSTNNKITKTINGTTSDVVTAATLKTAMSLGNVENKSSATIRGEITSSNVITALGFTPMNASLKGANNGVAELDSTGKVPASQLPSYVDDVLEYDKQSSFPATGETGKIYVAKDTNKTYRWSGTSYVEISPSLALGETSSTAYRGDRGKTAYDHASAKGSAFSSGLYKITTNAQGHVTAATAVSKADITGLGIPAQDTTYSAATQSSAGLMSAADKTKLDGIATGANKITKVSQLTNDSGYTTNTGTITGITMNGASKGTSGVVDLGTVITAHQDISGKVDKNQGSANAGKNLYVGSDGNITLGNVIEVGFVSDVFISNRSAGAVYHFNYGNNTTNAPTTSGGHGYLILHPHSTDWGMLECFPIDMNGYCFNGLQSGSFTSWRFAITTENIGSQSVNYANSANYANSSGSANSVAWGNVSGRPTNVSSFTNDSGYTTHQDISGKLDKSGGTMTGAITTSDGCVANGCRQASSTTIAALFDEVRVRHGESGSVNLTEAYESIAAGWYFYNYTPHREGGTGVDNSSYGRMVLSTLGGAPIHMYVLSYFDGSINVRKVVLNGDIGMSHDYLGTHQMNTNATYTLSNSRKFSSYGQVIFTFGTNAVRGSIMVPTSVFISKPVYGTFIYGGTMKEIDIQYVSDTQFKVTSNPGVAEDFDAYGVLAYK